MKKKGPDSLEGLLIAVVACLVSTLMFGTVELSSMLFVACIARYATNRNNASFPFMLANVLQAMTGPLAGYLAQRFSVRIVVFSGSILSFLGVAGCFFAEDIGVVTILWGIVFGTGLGFATLLLPVVINDYFIEQRSKALGVCYVGSPIAFFIFPSVFELLMENYGLSGTFLFLAGINMHCIPLSLLLTRPNFSVNDEMSLMDPDEGKNSREMAQLEYKVSEKDGRSRRSSVEVLRNPKRGQDALTDNNHLNKSVLDKEGFHTIYPNSKTSPPHGGVNHRESGACPEPGSVSKDHEYEQTETNLQLGVADSETLQLTSGDSCQLSLNNLDTDELNNTGIHCRSHCDKEIVKSDKSDHNNEISANNLDAGELNETEIHGHRYSDKVIVKSDKSDHNCELSENNFDTDELNKTKINSHSYCDKVIGKSGKPGCNCEISANNLDPNKTKMNGHIHCDKVIAKSSKSDPTSLDPPGTPVLLNYVKTDGHGNVNVGKNAGIKSQIADPPKSILKLYSDPVFILLCLINGLTNLNFGTLATVIIDFGRDHGIHTSYDKYIMMCISVTGVVGMLGFGWVTDGGYMTRTRWASLTLVIGCVCILLMPEASGFVLLIVPLSVFSVCQASFFPLIPAITAEYVEGEFQEVAISACNVLGGPMYLIIPPLIGYFRDGKGSYDNIFYLMAGLSIVNSISVFAIPYLARRRDNTKT